jgi:FkbM family methyltransferase
MNRSANKIYDELEPRYFGPEMDERVTVERLPEILVDVDVFVDIGASLGQYTFFANKVMQEGEIYSIEADPIRYERLRKNCEEWSTQSTNEIHVLNRAVTDRDGTVTFYVSDTARSGGLFPQNPQHREVSWEEVQVEGVTIDTLFADTKTPDLIKIDVEGSEYRVLCGARKLLEERKTRFLVEVHLWGDPTGGHVAGDVFTLFANYCYDYKRIHRHFLFRPARSRLLSHLKAIPPRLILRHKSLFTPVKAVVDWFSRRW